MPKQSGLGDVLQVDNSAGALKDISTDVSTIAVRTPKGLQDITGLDKSAIERLGLLDDGEVALSGFFNPTTDKSHDVFKVRTGTRTVQYDIGGSTTGNPRLSMEMLVESYDLNRAADGSLVWSATLRLQSGTVPTWTTVP